MKTILVADSDGREKHVGEDFDDFIEVDTVVEAETLDEWADRIRQRIRRLWVEGNSSTDVMVVLEAPVHYRIMLEHLQVTMIRDEKVRFLLSGE
jgi:hypothetical protein